MTGSRYAPGTEAWGLCQKCGLRFYLSELVFDGYYPELRVCSGCYDDKQPQEFLIDVTDPIALWKPSPEDPPIAPVLTGYGVYNAILLNWTQAQDNYGDGRVFSYAVNRRSSSDNMNWSAWETLATYVNIYYGDDSVPESISLADLVDNGNPPEDNWGIQEQTLAFTDEDVANDLFYEYQILCQFTNATRSVLSNIIDITTSQWHAIDDMVTVPGMISGTLIAVVLFSSRPYPVVVQEAINTTPHPITGSLGQFYDIPEENMNITPGMVSGTLVSDLITYSNWPPEPFNITPGVISGTLVQELITYTNWPAEPFNITPGMVSGTLLTELIIYGNWPAEPFNITPNMVSGTLT